MFLKLYLSSLAIGKFVEYSGALYLLISIISLPIKKLVQDITEILSISLDRSIHFEGAYIFTVYIYLEILPHFSPSIFEYVSWLFTWTNTILRSVVLYSPIKNTVLKLGFMYVLTQKTRFLLWSLFSCGRFFLRSIFSTMLLMFWIVLSVYIRITRLFEYFFFTFFA